MASNNSTDARLVKSNLREMMAGLYDSDHDFYEQLKKAIGYTGATYDGVCTRLIELMDDYALELKMKAIGEAHKRTMEAIATAEARMAELETELQDAQKVSAERDEAADWVEANGAIEEVKSARRVFDAYRDELVKIATAVGFDDGDLPVLRRQRELCAKGGE